MPYLFRLLISFIALSVLWITLVFSQIGNLTQSSKWVSEAYELKESYAKTIINNKIVIVSGSNSLFGFDSSLLESNWNIPVINGSVHAGLGMPYILYRSKMVLNRGDIVILPIEYSFYQADGKPSETYSDYILSRDGGYFRKLSLVDRLMVIGRISTKRLYQGIKLHFNNTLKPTQGIYGIQNINSHGDQINIEQDKMTKTEFSALDRISADIISTSKISDDFILSMDEYVNWAKDSGICIIAMPPNHMFFKEYGENKYMTFLSKIKGYYASRDVSYLGNPLVYMYQKEFYFNTSYHLNSNGVRKRTLQVINDIGEDPNIHCNGI